MSLFTTVPPREADDGIDALDVLVWIFVPFIAIAGVTGCRALHHRLTERESNKVKRYDGPSSDAGGVTMTPVVPSAPSAHVMARPGVSEPKTRGKAKAARTAKPACSMSQAVVTLIGTPDTIAKGMTEPSSSPSSSGDNRVAKFSDTATTSGDVASEPRGAMSTGASATALDELHASNPALQQVALAPSLATTSDPTAKASHFAPFTRNRSLRAVRSFPTTKRKPPLRPLAWRSASEIGDLPSSSVHVPAAASPRLQLPPLRPAVVASVSDRRTAAGAQSSPQGLPGLVQSLSPRMPLQGRAAFPP